MGAKAGLDKAMSRSGYGPVRVLWGQKLNTLENAFPEHMCTLSDAHISYTFSHL